MLVLLIYLKVRIAKLEHAYLHFYFLLNAIESNYMDLHLNKKCIGVCVVPRYCQYH